MLIKFKIPFKLFLKIRKHYTIVLINNEEWTPRFQLSHVSKLMKVTHVSQRVFEWAIGTSMESISQIPNFLLFNCICIAQTEIINVSYH